NFLVAGLQVRRGLRAQVALVGFKFPHLSHQTLAERRVRCQALVVLGNLITKIFFFELEQRFGIAALETRDEKAEEPAKEVDHPLPHRVPPQRPTLRCQPTRRFEITAASGGSQEVFRSTRIPAPEYCTNGLSGALIDTVGLPGRNPCANDSCCT